MWPECEQVLIHPYNDFQMCSKHTLKMHKLQYEFRQKVRRKRGKKIGGTNVINRNAMLNQIKPIGQPTDSIE
jgi:hypothetical protein